MKITHIYDYSAGQKKPTATVVQDGELYGVALCSTEDEFNKKLSVHIATKRMKKFGRKEPKSYKNRWVNTYSNAFMYVEDIVKDIVNNAGVV